VTIFYPDVSNNDWGDEDLTTQGQQNLMNFLSQLRGQGLAGVAHKMSQGSDYIDPYGAICQTWCAQKTFPFIGYHYLDTSDATTQAANWKAAGGGANAMFDWEDDGGDLGNFWDVVNSFNVAGVNVALGYMPQWYWEEQGGAPLAPVPFNGICLVSSAYPMDGSVGLAADLYRGCDGDSGEGWAPYGGATPTIWQFTDSASIAGFNVDCNAFQGSAAALQQLFTG
jgi:hypothetical protein